MAAVRFARSSRGLGSRHARKLMERGTSVSVWLYGATLVLFLSFWHHMPVHGPHLRAIATFALLTALSFTYGRVFVCATALDKASQSSLALELLCGYLVLNTILFFLIITSPLGLVAALAIVSIGG